jgi:hypothetical protein
MYVSMMYVSVCVSLTFPKIHARWLMRIYGQYRQDKNEWISFLSTILLQRNIRNP